MQYWPEFGTVSGNVFLHGYWQSELYFRHIRPVILSDFSVRNMLADRNEAIAGLIRACNSVSVPSIL